MKWKNRLKILLTETTIRSAGTCIKIQLRKAVETPIDEVSAVIRSDELRHFSINRNINIADKEAVFLETNANRQLRITAETKISEKISAVIRSYHLGEFSKNKDELAQIKSDKLNEILNRFIEKGITFEVSTNDFQVNDTKQILMVSDEEFIKLNYTPILCELQKSLLMKHLFSHSPFLLDDFAFEIEERESLMSETTVVCYESHYAAVLGVTRSWFERLLNEHK